MLDDSGDPDFKDEDGLREAYDAPDGVAVHGETMFIAGTRHAGPLVWPPGHP